MLLPRLTTAITVDWRRSLASPSTKPAKTVEQAVSHAVGHRIRIEIMAILHEGPRSPKEIGRLIGENVSKVNNHIRELLSTKSIELARIEKVRNADEHFYRAIEIPFLDDEEAQALSEKERGEVIGLILQAIMAEALASFWAGKMVNDERICLAWRWFNLDEQGRRDLHDEQAAHWDRVVQIETEACARRAESGGETNSTIVAMMGFQRSRKADQHPAAVSER